MIRRTAAVDDGADDGQSPLGYGMKHPMRTTRRAYSLFSRFGFVALVALAASPLCGCEPAVPPVAPENPAMVIDQDPLALFPGGPVMLGNLDARAFYTSGSTGAQLAAVAEGLFPLGQEAGFVASRDVDHVFAAVYAGAGLDAVALLSGRFDVPRIQALAASRAPTRLGAPCIALPYAGRTLFTVSNFAFSPLTDHTMVAGNESAVRRVLDRLALAGPVPHLSHEVADWMITAVQAPGSSFALAADIASIPPAALHGWPLPPAMSGLSRVATIGDFHPPGMNVASTLSYVDPARAGAGADGLRQVASFLSVASNLGGPRIQNLSIVAEGPNVGCKFALDDEAMRRTIASVMKLFSTATRPPGSVGLGPANASPPG